MDGGTNVVFTLVDCSFINRNNTNIKIVFSISACAG
jgi:hypothetical protein